MLTVVIFLLAVYGLANAIAMLKIGVYFFGDPEDTVVLNTGTKIHWKKLIDRGGGLDIKDLKGNDWSIRKTDIDRILARKGLGRIPYLGEMFYCPACLSFWIGMAASWWILSPAAQVCQAGWKTTVLDGLMACAASWLLHVFSMKMMAGAEDA
jgi:hypothetical protein